MKKWILTFLFFPLLSFAAVPAWKIVPTESSLTFTATQNNAPVSGTFKKFSGEIYFDPKQLAASHIQITVDIASLSDPYNQLVDTLESTAWFDVKSFPQAVFKSTAITKTGEKQFQAQGTLTIRDKTLPITLNFTQEEYTPTHARMKGSATLQRIAFGIGQGEWADTNTVKNSVRVDFVISAIR